MGEGALEGGWKGGRVWVCSMVGVGMHADSMDAMLEKLRHRGSG